MYKLLAPLSAVVLLAGCSSMPPWLGGSPAPPPPVVEPVPAPPPVSAPPPTPGAPATRAVHHHPVALHPVGTQDVKDLQKKLTDDGYYHGPIDGLNGPQTKAAVKAWGNDPGWWR